MGIKEYSDRRKSKLLKLCKEYYDNNDNPTVLGFAVQHGILKRDIISWPSFDLIRQKMQDKMELYLRDQLQTKGVNFVPIMFLLKAQHGYQEQATKQQPATAQVLVAAKSTDDALAIMAKLNQQHKQINTSKK